jgi:hypothetical protein
VVVQGDLKGSIYGQAVGSSRPCSSPSETSEEAYEEPWNMWLRARRRVGDLFRGVLEEVRGSQNISQFLN